MNANYQHLEFPGEQELLNVFWVHSPKFGFHWHYHPELEMTFVKRGRGTRLVGDNVSPFSEGDLVFMGSNLPHTWISDDEFNASEENMEVAVLQFHPNLLAGPMLGISEMKGVRRLLQLGERGLSFSTATREQASSILMELMEANGLKRFRLFLEFLDCLGRDTQPEQLASSAYTAPLDTATEDRILRVCRHVHEQFMRPISLDEAAKLAGLHPTSFCRFFKKSTGQTFFEYINDLRVGKACNLLLSEGRLSISEIGYRSGFSSQTLFNRIFKRKKSMTPTQFRRLRKVG